MKTLRYNGELFWQVTHYSAVRPDGKRIKVLTIDKDGSIQCRSRKTLESIRKVIEQEMEGLT